MEWLRGKIDTSLKLPELYYFKCASAKDNAKEYVSKLFQSFMLQNDILHLTSCVDTLSHNGMVERKNRHFLEIARALLFQMC